jgi:hypothetical protein
MEATPPSGAIFIDNLWSSHNLHVYVGDTIAQKNKDEETQIR